MRVPAIPASQRPLSFCSTVACIPLELESAPLRKMVASFYYPPLIGRNLQINETARAAEQFRWPADEQPSPADRICPELNALCPPL
jgi:hypothetical protein